MCGHIYKCGFTYISVSVIFTNVAIYRFLTQTAPYTNTTLGPIEREARGGLGHVACARRIHKPFCACALHVILFEGASRLTAALHKRSTAALHNGECFSAFTSRR